MTPTPVVSHSRAAQTQRLINSVVLFLGVLLGVIQYSSPQLLKAWPNVHWLPGALLIVGMAVRVLHTQQDRSSIVGVRATGYPQGLPADKAGQNGSR